MASPGPVITYSQNTHLSPEEVTRELRNLKINDTCHKVSSVFVLGLLTLICVFCIMMAIQITGAYKVPFIFLAMAVAFSAMSIAVEAQTIHDHIQKNKKRVQQGLPITSRSVSPIRYAPPL